MIILNVSEQTSIDTPFNYYWLKSSRLYKVYRAINDWHKGRINHCNRIKEVDNEAQDGCTDIIIYKFDETEHSDDPMVLVVS